MTRVAVFGLLVLAAVGRAPADDKVEVPKELAAFQGTWKVVKQEINGEASPDKDFTGGRLVIEGDRLTVREFVREGVVNEVKGSIRVSPKAEPAQLAVALPFGDVMRMIYKFDRDGRLTLCFVTPRGPAPKEFKTNPKSGEMLFVLEKVKE